MPLTVLAPAKLNLTLDSVGRREDGYHLLESVFLAVDRRDKVTAARTDGGIRLRTVGGEFCPVEKNTAYKAAQAFFAATGVEGGISLTVEKHIPMQAGMGGGSADAAAVIVAMNTLWDTRLPQEKLEEIGLTVGADVPFCLRGGCAMVTGIGEKIASLPIPDHLQNAHFVVAQPAEAVSTKEAYAALDAAAITRRPDHPAFLRGLKENDPALLWASAANVFEEAISLPGVTALRRAMEAHRPAAVQMTGSGSAVFAVCQTAAEAENLLGALLPAYPTAFICRACKGILSENHD